MKKSNTKYTMPVHARSTRLTLEREVIRELTDATLAHVSGAAGGGSTTAFVCTSTLNCKTQAV